MRYPLIATTIATLGLTVAAQADHIWINEFHYDNVGADVGEFVEAAIRNPNASGFTASDYVIEFYNGNGGALYGTTGTLNTFPTINAFGVAGSTDTITLYSTPFTGIQNGAPDGLALVNITNGFVESFLSYEGSFTATSGSAIGLTSVDVGVFEDGSMSDTSLGAAGIGDDANAFNAGSFILATTQTPGGINQGQTFAIPEPTSLALLGLGGLAMLRRRR